MTDFENKHETLVDYLTGKPVPNVGAEGNRQAAERMLVEEKGYDPGDIELDVELTVDVAGEIYRGRIDMVVSVEGVRFMAIKCAAGSLGSREREILAASRLLESVPLPRAVATDGRTAIVLDGMNGETIGEGTGSIPSKEEAKGLIRKQEHAAMPAGRLEKEKLIFRSYDSMNINRS